MGPLKISLPSSQMGASLVEMMIALGILSIATLGLVASFRGVQRSIQMSRDKTLATNLAQEQIQIIEEESYPNVVPTQNPSFLSNGTPYDTVNFPPENVLEGGVNFERYTYIQVISDKNGTLTPLPPTTPDTGMRQITVTIAWTQDGQTQYLPLTNVMSNPDTVEANSSFMGTVSDATTGNPIQGSNVAVAENLGWSGVTNASGLYAISLSPGSFNLVASAPGYFTGYAFQSAPADNTVTVNFSLTPMSSGTVTGEAWIEPNLLISQVVVSTPQANGYNVEYVELFNPTTNTIVISGNVNLNFVSGYNTNTQCANVLLTYVVGDVPPGQYYLIANTTTFTVNGSSISADAYYTYPAADPCTPSAYDWTPSAMNIMAPGNSGTIYLTDGPGSLIDAVGWTNGGSTPNPSYCNGTCIPQSGGLPAGQEIVRASSPSFVNTFFGPAYNSENNSIDFAYQGSTNPPLSISGIPVSPENSQFPPALVISGVPAAGAVITSNDGLSSSTEAVLSGSPPVAAFSLLNVATGTWSVVMTSASYETENDTVTVAASNSIYVFPSTASILNQTTNSGFIAGLVTDANGNPISVPTAIEVSAGGSNATANTATGRYLLRVSSGITDVTANPASLNSNYVSMSSNAITVYPGQIESGINFTLTQGGRLSGWVTRDGINGLEGISMSAIDSNGNTQDQEVTDATGHFQTINLATGAYTVRIPLDSTEVSNPNVVSASVLSGQTIFVGTFTITGAMGTLSGNVTLSGNPISTGVLIVVTTDTLPGGPPVISSASLTGISYYSASSNENGTFSVQVRQSTFPAYNIYGYYPEISPTGGINIVQKSLSNVPILEGQTVSGQNLSW